MTVLYTMPWTDGREVQVTQGGQVRLPDVTPRVLRAYDALAGDTSDETRLVTGAKMREIVAQMLRLSLHDEGMKRYTISVTGSGAQAYWWLSQVSGTIKVILPRGWRQRVFETGMAMVDGLFTLDLSPITYTDGREFPYALRIWSPRYRFGYYRDTAYKHETETWHSEMVWRDVYPSDSPRYLHMNHSISGRHTPSANPQLQMEA